MDTQVSVQSRDVTSQHIIKMLGKSIKCILRRMTSLWAEPVTEAPRRKWKSQSFPQAGSAQSRLFWTETVLKAS